MLVALGAVSWVGFRGLAAKSDLESAQALISQMKAQALDFDIAGARSTFNEVKTHTENAIELTSDPLWRTFESVPSLGKNLTVVRELAAASGDVLTDVAEPLLAVADKINPASLAPKDGAIDVTPFQDAIPAVAAASAGTAASIEAISAIDVKGTIPQLAAARDKVTGLLTSVQPLLVLANSILPLLPPALGSDEPRNYIIMFENPAEARPLGGTALSFAVVNVDKGKINLAQTISAGSEHFDSYITSVIPVPEGVQDIFPNNAFGSFIANATLRPSFITASEMTQEMWIRQFGYSVDGIVSIDPVALSYILRATDPIALASGDQLTPDTLVSLLLNEIYQRYNSGDPEVDNAQQDAVYSEAVAATFSRLTHGPLNPKALVLALMQAATEHRVMLWSTRPDEQEALVANGFAGELPKSDETTDRIGLYLQENVGSKLNYYLTSNVRLAQGSCRSDGLPNYRASMDLTSSVPDPASLSPSILGQWEVEKVDPGVQRMIVLLYAPPGSTILRITVNGEDYPIETLHDLEYPVAKARVLIPPGGTVTVAYDFVGGQPGTRLLAANVTPGVHATAITTEPLDCATAP